jgi:transposase
MPQIIAFSIWISLKRSIKCKNIQHFQEFFLTGVDICGIIYLTLSGRPIPIVGIRQIRKLKMNKDNSNNNSKEKEKILSKRGCLNPKSQQVKDELFEKYDFFDSKDLIQVKYEMLRRVKENGWKIERASKTFGFSRPSFYEAQRAFEKMGMPGLIPKKRGPKLPHKLSRKVMQYVEEQIEQDHQIKAVDLSSLIKKRFGVKVHHRSIQKALKKKKEKGKEKKN